MKKLMSFVFTLIILYLVGSNLLWLWSIAKSPYAIGFYVIGLLFLIFRLLFLIFRKRTNRKLHFRDLFGRIKSYVQKKITPFIHILSQKLKSNSVDNTIMRLNKLKKLHQEGLLDDDEFEKLKKDLKKDLKI